MLGLRRLRHERPVAERAAPRRAEAPQERLAPALTATPACVLARPAPAKKEAQREEAAKAAPVESVDAVLAQTQGADGRFGQDPRRTAAALLALVLLGNTRFKGLRRRTVTKAAAALEAHRALDEVSLALDALAAAESGAAVTPSEAWRRLTDAGPEGALLARLLR